MGYDRDDSFPFDFEPNGIPFGSKSKENCHHDHIPFNVKGNVNIVFLSVKRQPDRKTVTDRLIAVRETGVSWHHGGPIEGPPETPRTSQHYRIEGIKGIPDSTTKGNGNIVLSVYSNANEGRLMAHEKICTNLYARELH